MKFRDLFRGGAPLESTHHVPMPLDRSSRVLNYTITLGVGSFGNVHFGWEGTSEEDARESFFEYLYNPEFDLPGRPGWRSNSVVFYGKSQTLIFKPQWLVGFTIVRS